VTSTEEASVRSTAALANSTVGLKGVFHRAPTECTDQPSADEPEARTGWELFAPPTITQPFELGHDMPEIEVKPGGGDAAVHVSPPS
jgi:hypothetical protein